MAIIYYINLTRLRNFLDTQILFEKRQECLLGRYPPRKNRQEKIWESAFNCSPKSGGKLQQMTVILHLLSQNKMTDIRYLILPYNVCFLQCSKDHIHQVGAPFLHVIAFWTGRSRPLAFVWHVLSGLLVIFLDIFFQLTFLDQALQESTQFPSMFSEMVIILMILTIFTRFSSFFLRRFSHGPRVRKFYFTFQFLIYFFPSSV